MPSSLGGSGVFVKENITIPSQTVLMSVDEQKTINLYAALQDSEFGVVAISLLQPEILSCIDADMILLLFIVFDRYGRRGNKPRFQQYYESVPDFSNGLAHNLMLAPPEVISFLEIPAIEDAVDSLSDNLFKSLQWCATHVFPKVLSGITNQPFYPLNLFCVVLSRGIVFFVTVRNAFPFGCRNLGSYFMGALDYRHSRFCFESASF